MAIKELPKRPNDLKFSNENLTLEDMTLIAEKISLKGLVFDNCPLTDEHIKELTTLKNLVNLTIEGASITDASFEYLAQLPQLVYLYISNNPRITGNGLRLLQESKITHIGAQNTSFNDEGLKNAAQLIKLESIHLEATQITLDGLLQIASNPFIAIHTTTTLSKEQKAIFRAEQRRLSIKNLAKLEQAEIEKVKNILLRFFDESNQWETYADEHSNDDDDLKERCKVLFDKYCTNAPRLYGRPNCLSWGTPCRYANMRIVDTETISKSKIYIYCEGGFKGEQVFRFLMVKQKNDEWKLDKGFLRGAKWTNWYL